VVPAQAAISWFPEARPPVSQAQSGNPNRQGSNPETRRAMQEKKQGRRPMVCHSSETGAPPACAALVAFEQSRAKLSSNVNIEHLTDALGNRF